MFHDTHIHLEMLLDKLKMSNFGKTEILENCWQKNLENNNSQNLQDNSQLNLQKNQRKYLNSDQDYACLVEYFDKIAQIKISPAQKIKIEELFQNHEFAIHSTVNFGNFGLVYQLFSGFDKIKFLFGSHPEIVNTDFDLEKYLTNQQSFLKLWMQKYNSNYANNANSKNTNSQASNPNANSNWSRKIVGIGEIGLDYFYTKDQILVKIQQKLFESQINLSINWQLISNLGNLESLETENIATDDKIENQNSQQKFSNYQEFNSHNRSQNSQLLQNNLQKKLENNLSLPRSLPIVIHCREAFADLISILTNFPLVHNNFLVHCWTGNVDELRQVLDLGGIVAFGGILTYKSAESLRIAARFCPLDRLVLETDLPFLSPQSHRTNVCLPEFIDETCEILSQIKNVQKSLIWQKSLENTIKLFGQL